MLLDVGEGCQRLPSACRMSLRVKPDRPSERGVGLLLERSLLLRPSNGATSATSTGPDLIASTVPNAWEGILPLAANPVPPGVEGHALYSELWSKLRWALGGTFGMHYGKRSPWVGELSRRLTLLVLANRPDK